MSMAKVKNKPIEPINNDKSSSCSVVNRNTYNNTCTTPAINEYNLFDNTLMENKEIREVTAAAEIK